MGLCWQSVKVEGGFVLLCITPAFPGDEFCSVCCHLPSPALSFEFPPVYPSFGGLQGAWQTPGKCSFSAGPCPAWCSPNRPKRWNSKWSQHLRPAFAKTRVRVLNYPNSWRVFFELYNTDHAHAQSFDIAQGRCVNSAHQRSREHPKSSRGSVTIGVQRCVQGLQGASVSEPCATVNVALLIPHKTQH